MLAVIYEILIRFIRNHDQIAILGKARNSFRFIGRKDDARGILSECCNRLLLSDRWRGAREFFQTLVSRASSVETRTVFPSQWEIRSLIGVQ